MMDILEIAIQCGAGIDDFVDSEKDHATKHGFVTIKNNVLTHKMKS